MAVFTVLPGPRALSKSRASEICHQIGARAIHCIYFHFIQGNRPLSTEEAGTLDRLLEYGDENASFAAAEKTLEEAIDSKSTVANSNVMTVFVYPRTGTISPWSSQATDILGERGLRQCVTRIERGLAYAVEFKESISGLENCPQWIELLYDRMTQEASMQYPDLVHMFEEPCGEPTKHIPLEQIAQFNKELALGLDDELIKYLRVEFDRLQRDPTDVELFMFGQIHSEHCRHKQFNATWTIDGQRKDDSLFDMIRSSHTASSQHTISAYSDNAAVFEGAMSAHWAPDKVTGEYKSSRETVHYLGKVETHNHPTAISPYPGAATGSGGEIRDEGSVGRGSRPKAGLAGYCVSHLLIPGQEKPWELDIGKPGHIASSLDIMREAPLGSADYNNEFGRPCLNGFFYSLLTKAPSEEDGRNELRGYHKPIMIAGGVGTVRPQHALKEKGTVKAGDYLVVFGGPSMLIGLGGGAASSATSGQSSAQFDFASVQRPNAEVQRRAQEVINACTSLDSDNPILSIHDVGAGGLSNAVPELAHDCGLGITVELRDIESADKSMSPCQAWSNESQERYVAAISETRISTFEKIARRERCGFSIPGRFTTEQSLVLSDSDYRDNPMPIDHLPMPVLFGRPPKLAKCDDHRVLNISTFDSSLSAYLSTTPTSNVSDIFGEAVNRVLSVPAVGSKSFLITIGDRTVGGLTTRDQMVGPWQVPVADVAVSATSLTPEVKTGEAMATGVRPCAALISPRASAKMAVAESLLNLAPADLQLGQGLSHVKLSANWMSQTAHPGEGAALYDAVEAVAKDMCQQLGISIPVGKDSLSMKMSWTENDAEKKQEVTSPLSLVVTAFGSVKNIGNTWTPQLRRFEEVGENLLLFVDLALGRSAMGGSALAQTFGEIGSEAPDVRDVALFGDFFDAVKQLHESGIVLAYHDRSDGGLFTTLAEMMFAGRCGLDVMLDNVSPTSRIQDVTESMFNEELGAVFQIKKGDEDQFRKCFATCGPPNGLIKRLGRVPSQEEGVWQKISLLYGPKVVYQETRAALQRVWASTSYHMQRLRDSPDCADAEYANIDEDSSAGLSYNLTFNTSEFISPLRSRLPLPMSGLFKKPRVAILREQGVNGAAEMAFAFHIADFIAVDVHMTDIVSGRTTLDSFVGLAACGGFSHGDVLGAGRGWSTGPTENGHLLKEFKTFFERAETFTLGVCNGCQFLSNLKDMIPGAESWPTFEGNLSERYEARVCMVGINDSQEEMQHSDQEEDMVWNPKNLRPSVFLNGMHRSSLPIPVSHGEGRASFPNILEDQDLPSTQKKHNLKSERDAVVAFRYLDATTLQPTQRYPSNPNGSCSAIAGVRSLDGRVLAMMPHPERTIIRDCASWIPPAIDGDYGPWLRMFKSARRWVG